MQNYKNVVKRCRFEPNCDVLLRRIVLQLLKEFSLKGDEAPFSLRKENPMSHASWIPPTVGVWKLNINASWLDNVGASGVGWVVLDLLRSLISAGCIPVLSKGSSLCFLNFLVTFLFSLWLSLIVLIMFLSLGLVL